MSPVLRKSSPVGTLGFLRARGQSGPPATRHADACMGYSAPRYQSWEVAYYVVEARQFNSSCGAGGRGKRRQRYPSPEGQGGLLSFLHSGDTYCGPRVLPGWRIQPVEITWHASLGGRRPLGGKTMGGGQLCSGRRMIAPSFELGSGGQIP